MVTEALSACGFSYHSTIPMPYCSCYCSPQLISLANSTKVVIGVMLKVEKGNDGGCGRGSR